MPNTFLPSINRINIELLFFSLALSDVIFDLCLNIDISEDFSQLSVDNVALSLQSHDSPVSSAVWKLFIFSKFT